MSFLYPTFLYALFALSIPLIIHLFNFRIHKKVFFTNVSLLKDVEVTSKNVKQLKKWLVFLLRSLALTFLVLAFSQPFIPATNSNRNASESNIVLMLDNSLSMNAYDGSKRILSIVKERVIEFVNEKSGLDQFYLLTNDFGLVNLNPMDKGEIIESIEKIEISNKSKTIPEIKQRVSAIKKENGIEQVDLFIFSDFQISQYAENDFNLLDNDQINFIQIQSNLNENISLDSCWISNPSPTVNSQDSLYSVIHNWGNQSVKDFPIKTFLNNKQIWLSNVNLEAGESKISSIPLIHSEFGYYNYSVVIEDDVNGFDDNLFLSYTIDSSPQIYLLSDLQYRKYFTAIYKAPFKFDHDLNRNTDISYLSNSSSVIWFGNSDMSTGLIKEIKTLVNKGSSFVFIPEDLSNFLQYSQAIEDITGQQISHVDSNEKNLTEINLQSQVFKGVVNHLPENVSLPLVKASLVLNRTKNIEYEDILSFGNGTPALRRYPFGKGNIYLFTFSFNPKKSNFLNHSLFVPLMLNISYSGNDDGAFYYELNKRSLIETDNYQLSEEIFHIRGNQFDIIPELKKISGKQYIVLDEQIKNPGFYTIHLQDRPIKKIALNHSRSESDPKCYSIQVLNEIIEKDEVGNKAFYQGKDETLSESIGKDGQALKLWKYCIILALMFFVAEVLVLKFIKT